MPVTISVVICTHNRAQLLPQAIESIVAQHVPTSKYEIVIVDNASSDNTAQVVKEKFGHLDHVRYVFEANLGVSHARNAGWKAAQGKYVAYLDDDAIANPNWLDVMLQTFETVDPKPDGIAGKVILKWETSQPEWVTNRSTQECLAAFDPSPAPRFLYHNECFVEANVVFLREILEKLQGFSTTLGRQGVHAQGHRRTHILSHEGVDFFWKMQQAGYTMYYVPDMYIHHCIASSRLTPDWFYRCAFGQGISIAICDRLHSLPWWRQIIRVCHIIFMLIFSIPFHYTIWIYPKNMKRFDARLTYIRHLGYVLYMLRLIR